MSVWRIGYKRSPYSVAPLELYSWNNRFDDYFRKYRTLYCAKDKKTCFRELLADLRPNSKAMVDFKKVFGEDAAPVGVVKREWYEKHALVEATINKHTGSLVNIERLSERLKLMTRHAAFLFNRGIIHLDISELRKKDRAVTQYLSRAYFDEGKAGIRFKSHLDNKECIALFEGRAELVPAGEPIKLTPTLSPFQEVCKEFGLSIK